MLYSIFTLLRFINFRIAFNQNFKKIFFSLLKWIKEAWSYSTKETIINSFVKAGFIERPLEDQEVVESDTELLIKALEKITTVDSFNDDGFIE